MAVASHFLSLYNKAAMARLGRIARLLRAVPEVVTLLKARWQWMATELEESIESQGEFFIMCCYARLYQIHSLDIVQGHLRAISQVVRRMPGHCCCYPFSLLHPVAVVRALGAKHKRMVVIHPTVQGAVDAK